MKPDSSGFFARRVSIWGIVQVKARLKDHSARSSMDRASDYGSEGWGFESLRARCSPESAAIQRTGENSFNAHNLFRIFGLFGQAGVNQPKTDTIAGITTKSGKV